MFPYRGIEPPNTLGQLTRWDIPINRWLDIKFEQGLNDRGGAAIGRMAEDLFADGPEISAEEANQRYGLPTLKFDSPLSAERARLMHERKRAELTRLSYMESAEHSWFSGKALAGFGAQMIGSVLHPVDAALMFVPIVGSSLKAGGIAKMGGGALRQQLARGLITEEFLAGATHFPRFSAAFIEGAIGNAIAEIPLFIQNSRDQALYGPEDSAVNLLAGGLFASGIRMGLSGIGKALIAAAFVHRSLDPEVREAMFIKAVDDVARGRDIQVDELVQVDMNVIRARVAFDEARAMREAEAEIPRDVLDENVIQAKAAEIGLRITADERAESLPSAEELRVLAIRELQPTQAELPPERIEAERQKQVRALFEKKRSKFESEKDSMIEAERQAEVQRQIAAGKILPEEEIDRIKLKGESADSNDAAIVSEDLASIEQELKADADRRLGELTPEEREAAQQALDDELGQVEEKVYKARDKAVDAAIPCVIEGASKNV